MSAQGVGRLHFVEGTVNAVKYQNILETSLLPSISNLKHQNAFTFQQDGAPATQQRRRWLGLILKKSLRWNDRRTVQICHLSKPYGIVFQRYM